MSSFLGKIEEIPGISVDHFEKDSVFASAYFLSHVHTDHTKGLSTYFFDQLTRNKKFFYCSLLTKAIIENKFNDDKEISNVIDLKLDDPLILDYLHQGSKKSIKVTCLSAGHCPGSVMFLFTLGNKKNILYTGDFRIHESDLCKLNSLHNGDTYKLPIKIDKLYLDTTFLNLKYKNFPKRHEILGQVCPIIKNWLKQDIKNLVFIKLSATYGSEFLFVEIEKFLKKFSIFDKIHVSKNVYKVYNRISDLASIVTNDALSTRIHACSLNKSNPNVCEGIENKFNMNNILQINPSALRWIDKQKSQFIERDSSNSNLYHVCYSTHSSYNELEYFIRYFKPLDIHPCVCAPDQEFEMQKLLKNIVYKYDIMQLKSQDKRIHMPVQMNCKKLKIYNSDEESSDTE